MPDTVFQSITPPLKAVDLGDGTYAVACVDLFDIPYGGGPPTYRVIRTPEIKEVEDNA